MLVTKTMERINIDNITSIKTEYPTEFVEFCHTNNLKPPSITSSNGKALSAMLEDENRNRFWDRTACDAFVKKFSIETRDSIQLFNKHSQWGILTNSGTERGKLYIVYPYQLSKKHKMRKNFKFEGTEQEKNQEIDRIKSTIRADYLDPPNSDWQLGHKNPDTGDNTSQNLVLQPPIQAKYRDEYLFFDTLTKMPLPNRLRKMLENGEIELSQDQICEYLKLFESLVSQSL